MIRADEMMAQCF